MDSAPVIDAMRTAARALDSDDSRDRVRAIQRAQDALDAAKAVALADVHVSKDYELDGASTLTTWVRNELRMTAADAQTLVRAASTFAALPRVAEAALAGSIRADHVKAFTYGLKHIGPDVMGQVEGAFVSLAQHHDPAELFGKVRELRAAMFPDDLDRAYVKGMDKEDIQITPLMDGFHVTGFLNAVTGAKVRTVVDAVSAPTDANDTRTGAERRVQGLDDLMDSVLKNGLPSDKGVMPQLSVRVDADTLAAAAERAEAVTSQPHLLPDSTPSVRPATLSGFGAIGPALLMYFHCVSDFTSYLMTSGGGQAQILNAGRTRRLPTLKQRRSVLMRQDGVCATPGCHHTHLEIHHVVFWSRGGPTDLDLLVGLCVRCHHLLHRGLLSVTGNAADGFEFTQRNGLPLRRRRVPYARAA